MQENHKKECQFCAEFISVNAHVCRYCNNEQRDRKKVKQGFGVTIVWNMLAISFFFVIPYITLASMAGFFWDAIGGIVEGYLAFGFFVFMISLLPHLPKGKPRTPIPPRDKTRRKKWEERRRKIEEQRKKAEERRRKNRKSIPALLKMLEKDRKKSRKLVRTSILVGISLSLILIIASNFRPTFSEFKSFLAEHPDLKSFNLEDATAANLKAFIVIQGETDELECTIIGIFRNYYLTDKKELSKERKIAIAKEKEKASFIEKYGQ